MSEYYDAIYKGVVNYKEETTALERVFRRYHKGNVKTILDVSAGTGNFTFLFASRGYKTIGIDLSEEMLRVARAKNKQNTVKFLKMDMRNINLRQNFDAIVSLFGGFGYLLDDKSVKKCFTGVKSHLNKKGLFIFEFWQVSGILPSSSSWGRGYLSWNKVEDKSKLILRISESKFDQLKRIHTTDYDMYIIDKKSKKLLDSFREVHQLRAYKISKVKELLSSCGLKALKFYDDSLVDGKLNDACKSSFRVLAVATPK